MSSGNNEYTDAEAEEWNDEFVMDYGQSTAMLPSRCMQSGWAPGNGTVTFTIVQNDQQASQRGSDDRIIYRNTNQDDVSTELTESLGAERISNFNAFKSSVNQRQIMYKRVQGAIGRDQDDKIIEELDGTTNELNAGDLPGGSGSAGFVLNMNNALELVAAYHALTVGADTEVTCLLSIRAFLQLEQDEKITSRDYNTDMPLVRGRKAFRWGGALWMPYPRSLEGEGTDSAKCFMWDMNAVGWYAAGDTKFRVGFNDEHLYFYCNAQDWVAPLQLLDDGVLEFLHDDTEPFGA
jgi:hypothetical protein